MTSPVLISLAVLKVNWDHLRQDYLQNFMPIAAECIRLNSVDVVAVPQLRDDMRRRFGLLLPHNVLERLLRRLEKAGYVRLDRQGICRPQRTELSRLRFHEEQQRVLLMHEQVVAALVQFQSARYKLGWTVPQAEAALESYLGSSQVSFLAAAVAGSTVAVPRERRKGERYIVASFVRHLQETDSSTFDYFVRIAQGSMLAQAVFLPEPSDRPPRFRGTAIYLDTTLLVNALGYNGDTRREPCEELLKLLHRAGAELRCFAHNLSEMQGILHAAAEEIATPGSSDRINTCTEHFYQTGWTASDVLLAAARLEEDLTGLRVSVVETPAYGPEDRFKYVIDEVEFGEVLAEEVRYPRDIPRVRDVGSLSAIMRLREGHVTSSHEQSRALFVTTNTALAGACSRYFRNEDIPDAVPPCVSDRDLMTLLWLKTPFRCADLPRKRLIADCYAAMQPEAHLWHKYLQEIEKLRQREKLTPTGTYTTENVYVLRYSIEAKQALMERTLGDEDALTEGTVAEILEAARQRMQGELRGQLSVAREQTREERGKVVALEQWEAQRRTALRNRATSTAAKITRVVAWSVLAVLLVLALVPLLWLRATRSTQPLPWILVALDFGVALLYAYSLVWGVTVRDWLRALEIRLSEWVEIRLHSLAEA